MSAQRRTKWRGERIECWMEVKDAGPLRRCRKSKGYTQRELTFLVRRSHTTIYALESGLLKNISEDLACAIAARLGRDWAELFVAHEFVAMPVAATASKRDRARRHPEPGAEHVRALTVGGAGG